MTIPTPNIFPIDCNKNNPEFVSLINFISTFANSEIEKITSTDIINVEFVDRVGKICQEILLTKTGENTDLLDSEKYSENFIGKYSEDTTLVFNTIKDICQLSWDLDTYPTLELIDNGIRNEDAEAFYSHLTFLKNTLENIQPQL